MSEALTGLDLPSRLELGAEGFGTHGDLWRAGAGFVRSGGPGAQHLGETLETIEPLLSRSFLLGQPSLAGMGLAAWDLAVATPGEALWERQLERSRRMVARSAVARLDDEEPEQNRADDADALSRGADLIEAIQRLDAASAGLPEDAPEGLRDQVMRLRQALDERLTRERRHHRTLDRALRRLSLDDLEAAARLRGQPITREPDGVRPSVQPRDPYLESLDLTLARDEQPQPGALTTRVLQVAQAAQASDPESATGRRLTEQARRLFAEETARAQLTPETVAARRALADRPGTSERPTTGDLTVRPGLPEVPVWSSRGEKAKVIGYLRAGERIDGASRGDHIQVTLPGGKPGWITAQHLTRAALEARGPRLPDVALPAVPPTPELARLASLVARETGQSAAALLARAIESPEFARELPKKAPRRDRGEAMATPTGPLHIERVEIDGLAGAPEAAHIVDAALTRLPHVLERRLADPSVRDRLRGSTGEVKVSLTVDRAGDARVQADVLADRMADALLRAQATQIDTLRLGVRTTGGHTMAPERALLARLAGDDLEGIATELVAERKELDATQQARLAGFFGEEFKDVMIFAGPMAGALARSLEAEAITHGRMIFFDPAHFRPDSPRGEALLAHELSHTRQADDRDVKVKEAEALATEAAYLDWIKPGEAPFTFALDVAAPAAQAAADVAGGMQRATPNRQVEQTEGPRKEVALEEKKVEGLMKAVQELLQQDTDFEGQRVGALRRIINRLTT